MGSGITGNVFNIQPFSIHDGPGIRTTVFLKGCSLSCLWCHNPESQSKLPELLFDADRCIGCGRCVSVCPEQAITLKDGRSWTDRSKCCGTGECARVCPNGAREIVGVMDDVGSVFEKVIKDELFYRQSGGGVTLSGGEPLLQPKFSVAFLARCKEAGLHTAIDTCGYAKWSVAEQVLKYTDLVLFDLKHMDSIQHKKLTGVPNELILENAKRIYHQTGVAMQVRTSIVPGYNDSEQNIEAIAEFVARELSPSVEYYLLPYHKFGETKQEQLEWGKRRLLKSEPPSESDVAKLKQIAEASGLTVYIGG